MLRASLLALLLISCSGDREERSSDTDVAVCLQGAPAVADGVLPLDTDAPGTAREIRTFRWETHEGCGRFVVDFTAEDGRPAATVGEVRAEVLRDVGVVRLTLPDVERVHPEATEARFDGLARAAYSVRSEEGRWVYVDLHLAEEAAAYAAVLEEPGRVLVDLRPGGAPIPPPAVLGQRVVVLEPRQGVQTYPLTVTGYARTFEATVLARIEHQGEEIDESFTTATAWADTWGHYSITFGGGPSGPVEVHVGEYSARDGTWEGVVVEVEMQ